MLESPEERPPSKVLRAGPRTKIGVRFAINIWGYNYSTIPANAINLSVINSSSFSVEFLSNPSLVNVDTNAFVSIKGGITSLWLYNGGIQEIPFEVLLNTDFACVDGVGPDISFQFNKISRVPENQFERLMEKIGCSFGNIYLGQNNIQNLTDGSFSNLIIANSLDLTGNQITQISSGAFQNISIGYQLQLGYNNITDIDPEAFEMATIDTLTLSYNQLIEIPYEAVTKINLTGDRMLQLDHNLIVNIHPEKFNVMLDGIGRSSISIDLSSNQITVLKQGVFRDLDNSWIGLMENKIIEMESESFYNVDFNSIFFLVLAENVTFANDTFRAPVSFESYDISIGQQKIDQPSSACILSNDSIPNICGNLQLSISNIFYMENYCPDILQNLACFNRITLSINLPGGDPKKQNFTYLGTIPSTITPLNSIELHTNPSSSGICFDGNKKDPPR
uniref:Uncharacterized protein n=1 Tax=Acrobeloides nanus TaxID=290746 RepID=A0A914DML7_9BILA